MKARNVLTVILAFFLVLALAYSAQARAFGPGFNNGRTGRALDGMQTLLALRLTDAQQEQLSSIISKYRDQGENLRTEMRAAQKSLRAVLDASPFDEGNARAAFQSASAVREKIFIYRAKMIAEMKSVLTPEQLNQLKERRTRKFRRAEQSPNPGPQNPSE
jgi:Spy/CpxP family protein refolding chaperone